VVLVRTAPARLARVVARRHSPGEEHAGLELLEIVRVRDLDLDLTPEIAYQRRQRGIPPAAPVARFIGRPTGTGVLVVEVAWIAERPDFVRVPQVVGVRIACAILPGVRHGKRSQASCRTSRHGHGSRIRADPDPPDPEQPPEPATRTVAMHAHTDYG